MPTTGRDNGDERNPIMFNEDRLDPGIPHLDLPIDDIRTLAGRMAVQPSAAEQNAITKTVREMASWPGHLGVSPSRVAETLELDGVSVSAEQVAWAMLQADR